MPSRYDDDSDDERLPEGMVRVGYDADDQVYTFRDADGSLWEGPPGCRYGHLTKVSNGPPPRPQDLANLDIEDDAAGAPPSYSEAAGGADVPFLNHAAYNPRNAAGSMAKHWRAELMPLLNFFMILVLVLIGLFWFLGFMSRSATDGKLSGCVGGSHGHQIQAGETCYGVAQMHDITLEELLAANGDEVDCSRLHVGSILCVPAMPQM